MCARSVCSGTDRLSAWLKHPWPAGGIVHESIKQGHRALKGISFFKEDAGDNPYAKPINGVIGHVDLTLGEVVCVEDHGVDPIPEAKSNYDAASQTICSLYIYWNTRCELLAGCLVFSSNVGRTRKVRRHR